MRIREILELSVDLADPVRETSLVIRAVLDRLRNPEDQAGMLRVLGADIDSMLKGVERIDKSLYEPGRKSEDQ
ncbi:hypothetical protein [Paenibacillus sp. FSL L8-0708]|uniref:hypothetical protein n=1 Tax=Paenibacillus sp. FSL L8-0708 TaxID=2975311 RepID=UPI0030F507EC